MRSCQFVGWLKSPLALVCLAFLKLPVLPGQKGYLYLSCAHVLHQELPPSISLSRNQAGIHGPEYRR
jgi:hypothetical protein